MKDEGELQKKTTLLLSAKQVAVQLSVSPRQVLRLGIPRVVLGHRTIRYEKEDLDAFIQKRREVD